MLSMRLSFDRDTIKEEGWMNRLVLFMRENNLDGLFTDVGVKFSTGAPS